MDTIVIASGDGKEREVVVGRVSRLGNRGSGASPPVETKTGRRYELKQNNVGFWTNIQALWDFQAAISATLEAQVVTYQRVQRLHAEGIQMRRWLSL